MALYDQIADRVAARYKRKKQVPSEDGGKTTVYEYSKGQVDHRNREKAKRLESLKGNITKLRSRVQADLKSSDPEKHLTALVVGLIDETFERVGNDQSAKEGHFGVTGWKKDQVTFSGGKATIKYVGKSGVKQEKTVTNKALVSGLKKALDNCTDGSCFTYDGGKITADKVNSYLKEFNITAKDIRGYHANEEMRKALKAQSGGLPSDPKKREKVLKDKWQKALEQTAKAVGHEASTLKSQYLVPGLMDSYLKDGTVMERLDKKAVAQRVAARWLQARAIRLDKGRIKELAKQLEQVIAQKARGPRPLGNKILVPAAPYDVQAVDGTTINVYVRLNAIETDNPYYVVNGGFGWHKRYQAPIIVVNVNGSLPGEDIGKAARARTVQSQLYPVLLHELTHAADKFSKGIGERMTMEEAAKGPADYYNDPSEVRAYMQEVVDEINFKNYPKFEKVFGPGKALEYLLKTSRTWQEVSPHWSEGNKRLVIKAVVQALNDQDEL